LKAPSLKCQLNLSRPIFVLLALPTETSAQNLFHSHSLKLTRTTFSDPTSHPRLHPFDPLFLARADDRPCLTTTTRTRRATDTVYVFRRTAFCWEIVLYDSAHPWQVKAASGNACAEQNRCPLTNFMYFRWRGECAERRLARGW
jgi:hypothetical protein